MYKNIKYFIDNKNWLNKCNINMKTLISKKKSNFNLTQMLRG